MYYDPKTKSYEFEPLRHPIEQLMSWDTTIVTFVLYASGLLLLIGPKIFTPPAGALLKPPASDYCSYVLLAVAVIFTLLLVIAVLDAWQNYILNRRRNN